MKKRAKVVTQKKFKKTIQKLLSLYYDKKALKQVKQNWLVFLKKCRSTSHMMERLEKMSDASDLKIFSLIKYVCLDDNLIIRAGLWPKLNYFPDEYLMQRPALDLRTAQFTAEILLLHFDWLDQAQGECVDRGDYYRLIIDALKVIPIDDERAQLLLSYYQIDYIHTPFGKRNSETCFASYAWIMQAPGLDAEYKILIDKVFQGLLNEHAVNLETFNHLLYWYLYHLVEAVVSEELPYPVEVLEGQVEFLLHLQLGAFTYVQGGSLLFLVRWFPESMFSLRECVLKYMQPFDIDSDELFNLVNYFIPLVENVQIQSVLQDAMDRYKTSKFLVNSNIPLGWKANEFKEILGHCLVEANLS
jgi:hypothetical protein